MMTNVVDETENEYVGMAAIIHEFFGEYQEQNGRNRSHGNREAYDQ